MNPERLKKRIEALTVYHPRLSRFPEIAPDEYPDATLGKVSESYGYVTSNEKCLKLNDVMALFTTDHYVISSREAGWGEEVLYWNNDNGWGDIMDATLFVEYQKDKNDPPKFFEVQDAKWEIFEV